MHVAAAQPEQQDPDHVHEVPVQRWLLDHVVVLRGELARHATVQHDAQHQDATEHVGEVEVVVVKIVVPKVVDPIVRPSLMSTL